MRNKFSLPYRGADYRYSSAKKKIVALTFASAAKVKRKAVTNARESQNKFIEYTFFFAKQKKQHNFAV